MHYNIFLNNRNIWSNVQDIHLSRKEDSVPYTSDFLKHDTLDSLKRRGKTERMISTVHTHFPKFVWNIYSLDGSV